jgi:hypothetical protein
VNLADVVGGTAHIMLNQASAFHHGDLCDPISHLDTHHVTTNGATFALATFATLDDLGVDLCNAALG